MVRLPRCCDGSGVGDESREDGGEGGVTIESLSMQMGTPPLRLCPAMGEPHFVQCGRFLEEDISIRWLSIESNKSFC